MRGYFFNSIPCKLFLFSNKLYKKESEWKIKNSLFIQPFLLKTLLEHLESNITGLNLVEAEKCLEIYGLHKIQESDIDWFYKSFSKKHRYIIL